MVPVGYSWCLWSDAGQIWWETRARHRHVGAITLHSRVPQNLSRASLISSSSWPSLKHCYRWRCTQTPLVSDLVWGRSPQIRYLEAAEADLRYYAYKTITIPRMAQRSYRLPSFLFLSVLDLPRLYASGLSHPATFTIQMLPHH